MKARQKAGCPPTREEDSRTREKNSGKLVDNSGALFARETSRKANRDRGEPAVGRPDGRICSERDFLSIESENIRRCFSFERKITLAFLAEIDIMRAVTGTKGESK